jgi:hypothetical protein
MMNYSNRIARNFAGKKEKRDEFFAIVDSKIEEITCGYNVKRNNKRVVNFDGVRYEIIKQGDKISVE